MQQEYCKAKDTLKFCECIKRVLRQKYNKIEMSETGLTKEKKDNMCKNLTIHDD